MRTLRYGIAALMLAALIGATALLRGLSAGHFALRDAQTVHAAEPVRGAVEESSGRTLKVATYLVKPQPFAEVVRATGTLRAEEGVALQAETNGKIVAINFTEGSQVRKGQLLVKVNDADLRAALARATYRRELAQARERRLAKLMQQRMIAQDDYDSALSEVNVQDAEIALTRAQIAKTEIRAPFDGVVGLRFVSDGAYVNASTRIATLQSLARMKIDFSIPQQYAGRVRVGAPITFSVAGGIADFHGEIYAIDPVIDSDTRTMLVRALCRNDRGLLLPGAFANVEMTVSELHDAILIPAEAVVAGLDEKGVFVISNGHAERRMVQTGTRTSSAVHVLSGLKAGDVVITSGLMQLRAGQAVRPQEGVGAAATP